MACVELLFADHEVIRQTLLGIFQGAYEGQFTFSLIPDYMGCLIRSFVVWVHEEGPAFRLERRPEPEAGVSISCLERPLDVITAITDIAESHTDLLVQALGLEPVDTRVRGLLKMLLQWQRIFQNTTTWPIASERDAAMRIHFLETYGSMMRQEPVLFAPPAP